MIDPLLTECAERGWLLNNLFQLDNGTWQCNLRTATHFTAYGRGFDATMALGAAMDCIENAQEFTEEPTCVNQSIEILPNKLDLSFLHRPKANPFQGRRL